MLEIVLIPKTLGPPKSGALGLSLFSLMVNPRLTFRLNKLTTYEPPYMVSDH